MPALVPRGVTRGPPEVDHSHPQAGLGTAAFHVVPNRPGPAWRVDTQAQAPLSTKKRFSDASALRCGNRGRNPTVPLSTETGFADALNQQQATASAAHLSSSVLRAEGRQQPRFSLSLKLNPRGGFRAFHQTSTRITQLNSGICVVKNWLCNTPDSGANETRVLHRVGVSNPTTLISVLSHRVYLSVSFRKSTPPQKYQLIVHSYYFKY